MSPICVLGGYGGFGGRIARDLAAAGHDILVAGRSLSRAHAFCADDPRLTPVAADRDAIAALLAHHRPVILVDASGPFQAMDDRVPRACIAAGVHYIDIADARGFVCGIAALDELAQAAQVVILSGASSVPALTGAVVRDLADGFETVSAVEIALSAAGRAPAGPAVTRAILAQLGRPFALWRGQREDRAFGWQDGIRQDFDVAGAAPLRKRRVALVDVPDCGLLPARLPGRPATLFRAGTEFGFQNRTLALIGRLVRHGLIRNPERLAPWLGALQALTARAGSDRSAMRVALFGRASGRRIEHRWTLIADKGDGPEIPALAIAPLVARILDGRAAPGARDAGTALALADYQPGFDRLAIRHQRIERTLPPPLYARVMGADFARLPPALRAIHSVTRDGGAQGRAEVEAPANILAALVRRVIGLPRAGTHDLHVSFTVDDDEERWTRRFGAQAFASHMAQKGSWLTERFGLLRFGFALPVDADGLRMVLRRWWIGPLPLPLLLAPRASAREWAEAGRFHFDVAIALPLIGPIIRYRGWLDMA